MGRSTIHGNRFIPASMTCSNDDQSRDSLFRGFYGPRETHDEPVTLGADEIPGRQALRAVAGKPLHGH